MSIQEQAVQMIRDLSDENVIFLIDFMERFMLPKKDVDYKPEVLEAMKEAKQISRNPDTKRYASFTEAMEDLEI